MPISKLCQNLVFTNAEQVGACFTEFVFFASPDFAALILLALFGLIGFSASMPLEVMFPSFLGVSFVLWLMAGSTWLLGLFLIGLLIGGILLGLNFVERIGRGNI